MASRRIPIALLAGVLVLAHFALNVQPDNNGSWDLIKIFTWSETHLAGSNIAIQIPRTGIAAVDSYLTFMTSFFGEALNTNNFRARIQLNKLLGTLGSGWLLMLVEAHRGTGSSVFRIVTYLIELGGELLGVGLFMPIWCIVHLSMTTPPSGETAAPDSHWGSLGYAFALGHVLPTALQILTEPDGAGWSSQQLWTILRLLHPLFVLGSWTLLKARRNVNHAGETSHKQASIRKFYLYTILYSAIFHMSTFAILWIPAWLPTDVLDTIDAKVVLLPVGFWKVQSGISFADSVSIFLQWDDICAASALVVWSVSLYVEALPLNNGSRSSILNIAIQTISIMAGAGPVAASAFLLQERDGILLKESDSKAKVH